MRSAFFSRVRMDCGATSPPYTLVATRNRARDNHGLDGFALMILSSLIFAFISVDTPQCSLSLNPRIVNRIPQREMINHLPAGCQSQIFIDLVVEERADSGPPQPLRFRREIEPLANGAGLEMRIPVTAVAIHGGGPIQIR